MGRWLAVAALAAAFVAGAVYAVHRRGEPARAKASFDSLAPPGAPAHWLPPEDWVYNHWLPYDEGRLYALLHVTRGDIWRQLRDDHHTLAELAAEHGWPDAKKLARVLVAPRQGHVPEAMVPVLRERAERTITQGHLAQHLFFHSLHQFAIPSEAPEIFGVTDASFRELRRGEESPLDIGRVHGRSPAAIETLAAGVLRERVRAGVRTGAMTDRQGRLLLGRQLAQLPRWLAQVRYNGPPPTHDGKLIKLPRDYAANPAMAADGRHVVFEAYQQHLPLALTHGEISVQRRVLGGAVAQQVSAPSDTRRGPQSSYNPSVSADGRIVAFESAEGNDNFAKRYGAIRVFVRDVATGRQREVGRPTVRLSRSAFNPALAADGHAIAYQAVMQTGRTQVFVTRLPSGRTVLASRADADTYEPSISADGTRVAFTTVAAGHSQVFVRELERRRTVRVSGAASSPAISGDGRDVAYVKTAPGGGSQVRIRNLRTGGTTRVSGPDDGVALGPAISRDGRFVAYTSLARGRSTVMVRDMHRRAAVKVAQGADPSISADGRRVAFSSTATNLSPGKPDDRRGVFVRNLRSGRTSLVSAPVPPPSAGGPKPALAPPLTVAAHHILRPHQVAIVDNAFHHGTDRPVAHLQAGERLTWLWRSRQSHQVTLASGPTHLQSPTQAHGRFSATLTQAGTYQFVCSIHAPGMRMTAIVR